MEKVGNLLKHMPERLLSDTISVTDNSVTPEQMHCDWYNQTVGKLTGYDCPKCKNRGYIAVLEDGYEIHKECECMKIRQTRQNIARSGLSEAIQTMTFDAYICKEPWQERLKAAAMHYANKNRSQWLYIGGQSGAGKTHLCTAVCGVLLERGVQIRYELWRTIYRDLSDYRTQREKLQQLSDAEVLYIDDFLKSSDAAKEVTIAFEVIGERYARNKTTIISSEYVFDGLKGIDPALAGRIKERCGGYMFRIDMDDSRNHRL